MKTRIAFPLLIAGCVGIATACGDGSSPSSPSSSYPNVAGNYSGSTVLSYPSLGTSVTCPTTTTVTQSGANVSIAPLTFSGACASLGALPAGDFTMTTTGSLGSATATNIPLAFCNGSYNGSASGGFFGSTFQFSLVYTAVSGGCVTQLGNFSVTANLSK
jgi:hypothetical protein